MTITTTHTSSRRPIQPAYLRGRHAEMYLEAYGPTR